MRGRLGARRGSRGASRKDDCCEYTGGGRQARVLGRANKPVRVDRTLLHLDDADNERSEWTPAFTVCASLGRWTTSSSVMGRTCAPQEAFTQVFSQPSVLKPRHPVVARQA